MASESVVRVLFLGDTSQAVRSVSRLEGSMAGLGRTAKLAAGALAVGLVGGLAIATKKAIDFQHAMELVHTQAGASQKEVENMSKALLKLAGSVGTTPDDLAKGLFHIESAGLRGANALEVLTAAAKGAKVGQADLESVTNALVGAFKSGIKGAGSMEHAMGVLNATVGAGNMRMNDLTGALGTGLLSKANAVGVSIQDVGAAMAELTVQGQHSTDAATRLSMAFLTMAAPTGKKAADALHSIGLTTNQLASDMRTKGLIPALGDLKTHLDDSGKSAIEQTQILAAVFGRRSLQGLLPLIQHLDDLKKREDQINATTKDFGGAWQSTTKTLQFQMDRAKASISAAMIPIGGLLLPLLSKVLTGVADLAISFQEHFGQIKEAVRNAVDYVRPTWQALMQDLQRLWEQYGKPALESLQNAAEDLVNSIRAHWPLIRSTVEAVLGAVRAQFESVVQMIKTFWPLLQALTPLFKVALVAIVVAVRVAAEAIKIQAEIMAAAFRVIAPAVQAVATALRVTFAAFPAIITGAKNAFVAFWKWLEVTALNTVLAIVEPFSHLPFGLGTWAQKAKDRVNDELGKIKDPQVYIRLHQADATEVVKGPGGQTAKVHIGLIGSNIAVLPKAGGGRIGGAPTAADTVPAMLSPGEFVVTGGGEQMLESMTFPGVLNWLQGAQPRHFAAGGFAGALGSVISPPVSKMVSSAGTLGPLVQGLLSIFSGGGPGGRTSSGANVNLGRSMAASRGWVGANWNALNWLWTQESGWSNTAKNPTSGAYGIPQALPPTKMPFAAQEAGGSHAGAQIGWGLGYIGGRYGSPSGAWAHEKAFNWYRGGGRVLQMFAGGGRVRKPPKRGHYKPRSVGALLGGAAMPGQPELENLNQIIAHISRLEDDKSFLDQEYGVMSSRFDNLDYGQSFVNDDGSVNQPFVDQRTSELNQLLAERDKLRQKVIEQREEYAKGIAQLVKAIAALQKRLEAAMKKVEAETEEINNLNNLIYQEQKKKPTQVKTADQWVTSVSETKDAKGKIHRHVSRHLKKGGTKSVGGPDQDKMRVWRHRISELSHDRTQQKSLMNTIKGQLSGDKTQLTGWQHDYRFLPLDIAGTENDMGTLNNDLRDLGSPAAIFKKYGTGTGGATAAGNTTGSIAADAAAPDVAALLAQIARLNLALGIQGAQIPIIAAFQKGTLSVPETGLALVHAGESITPAGQVRGGDGGSIGNIHLHATFIVEDGAVDGSKIRLEAVRAADEIGRKIGVAASDRLRANRF